MGEDGWDLHNAIRARYEHAKEQGPKALEEFARELIAERQESSSAYLYLGLAFHQLGDEQSASKYAALMSHLIDESRDARASQDPRVAYEQEANLGRDVRSWSGGFERRLKRVIVLTIGLCKAALNESGGIEAVERLHSCFSSLAELLLVVRHTNLDPIWFERDARLSRLLLKAPVGLNLSREHVGILSSYALICRSLTEAESQTILRWSMERSVVAFAHIPNDRRA